MEILRKFKARSEKGEISNNPKVPTRQEIETLVENVTNTLMARFKERGGKEFLEENNTQKNEQTQNNPQEIKEFLEENNTQKNEQTQNNPQEIKEFLEKNNTQKNEQTQNIPQEINNVSVQGANNTAPINANHINMNTIVSDIIDRVNSLEIKEFLEENNTQKNEQTQNIPQEINNVSVQDANNTTPINTNHINMNNIVLIDRVNILEPENTTNTLMTRFKERDGKEFSEKISSENNTQKNEQTQNIPQEINNVSVQGANNTTPINANHINMNTIVSDIIDRVNSLEPISLSDYQ
jgi:hypothetical protein